MIKNQFGFSVTCLFIFAVILPSYAFSDPVLINLSPNRGRIGSSVTATVRYLDLEKQDQDKVYINGVLAPVRRVYGVTGSEDLGKVLFFIPPNVISTPNSRPLTLQVTVEVGGVQSNPLDYTLYPSPMITDIEPASGMQGEQIDVTIRTANLRLRPRGLRLDFGSGIQVSDIQVAGSDTITASLEIAQEADPGLRDVTIRMGRGRVTKVGGFTVTVPASATTLNLRVNPVPSPVFSRSVVISGAVNQGAGFGTNGTISQHPSIITAILPSSGAQGQQLLVEITGQDTHFAENSTQLSFGPGISVLDANVTGPNRIVANIKIDTNADTGERHLIAVTGAEEATSVVAFNVVAGSLTVSGKVVDQNGNPIPGAEISIKNYNLRTATDANGLFTLLNVPSGKQMLIVSARNFAAKEFEITGENGQTLNFSDVPIELERKAAPPSDTGSLSLLSLLALGANRIVAPTNIEEAKELIMNSIVAVGGQELGVLDENGNQLNPQIDANGTVSLTYKGLENLAKKWAIEGDVYRLADALFFFNAVAGWDPAPPSYKKWIEMFNNVLANIWNEPESPGHSLFVLVFNKGNIISNQPPVLSVDTALNPLQMYLLVNSFVAFMQESFYEASTQSTVNGVMVASLDDEYQDTISDMGDQVFILADNDDGSSGSGQGGTQQTYGLQRTWDEIVNPNLSGAVIGKIDGDVIGKLFKIDTEFVDADLQRALLVEGVEKEYSLWSSHANLVQGFVSGLAGTAVQNLYNPILSKFQKVLTKYGAPEPPRLLTIFSIKTDLGYDNILIFDKSPGDKHDNNLPKFYYAIYRKDPTNRIQKIVKPSTFFHETKDGHLFYIDHAPSVGGFSYFLQSFIKRSRQVPPSLNWGPGVAWDILTGFLPGGGYVLNELKDVLDAADKIYHALIFQKSDMAGPYSVIIANTGPIFVSDPNIDIAIDRQHGKEYISVGNQGLIYVDGPDGWTPIINTYFAKPHNKGLAIDSQGWLYTENAASEDLFGGRVFGFKNPFNIQPGSKIHTTEDRYLVGSVNYYSPVLQYANPVSLVDMKMGHWNEYIMSAWVASGVSPPPDTSPGTLVDAANTIFANATGSNSTNNSSGDGVGIPDFDPESIGILELFKQSFKVLDRRYGQPAPAWPGRNVAQTICRFNNDLIVPDSHIEQHPVYSGLSFINSLDNVYYFDDIFLCSNSHKLFSDDGGSAFNHISDIYFDDSGDLFLTDLEKGTVYVVKADAVLKGHVGPSDICALPYHFDHPFTLKGSADGEDLLVADHSGIHRVPMLVPYDVAANDTELFKTSTVLVKKNGSFEPVAFCNDQKEKILLPQSRSDEPLKLVLRPNDPSAKDETILIGGRAACYVHEGLGSTSANVTVEWQEPQYFDFTFQIPQDKAGKMVIRGIQLPAARLVPPGEVTDPPSPVFTGTIVEPESVLHPCGDISPLIVFAPQIVKAGSDTFTISGITTDSAISSVTVKDDTGHVKIVDVEDGVFNSTLRTHAGRINVTVMAKSGNKRWYEKRYVYASDAGFATLTGTVVDITSKIPISFTRIQIPELQKEFFTDIHGYFSTKVPVGRQLTLRIYQ